MKYFIANWKSNKTLPEVKHWLEVFSTQLSTRRYPQDMCVLLAVPFPFLSLTSAWLENWKQTYAQVQAPVQIELAVQDVSHFPAGSYTGAVSAMQLKEFGVKFALVGHSERRIYFHENSREVSAKVTQLLGESISPVICVDAPYIEEQATELKLEIPFAAMKKVLVAYEALDAIGTGESVDSATFLQSKEVIQKAFGEIPVLYGGSVSSENVREYVIALDEAQCAAGVLVGTASLDPMDFIAILDRVNG